VVEEKVEVAPQQRSKTRDLEMKNRQSKLKKMMGSAQPEHEDDGSGFLACAKRFVASPRFETVFACLIVANTLVMAAESQYSGVDVGFKLGHPGTPRPATEAWPGAEQAFEALDWIFGVSFTVELFVKICVMRCQFCKECWNIIDSIIVGMWLFTSAATFPLPIDPMLLRLARLARLLRLLKLIRTIQLFDSLYLMTTAMIGSFSVLLWSVVLLGIVQMMIACLLQSLLQDYILDDNNPMDARKQVFKFYGTFARAMLTMFEMTLGNWMVPCRALVENVSEWYMIFSLLHKMVIGFSVVTVMTAVFIQETFKVASIDDGIMMMNKERAKKTHMKKIGALFEFADKDNDGEINPDEFKLVVQDQEVRTWLAAMELDVRDDDELFQLLDTDHNGRLSADELVTGVSRLKGSAKNYDMVALQKGNDQILALLDSTHKLAMVNLQKDGGKLKELLQQTCHMMELRHSVPANAMPQINRYAL